MAARHVQVPSNCNSFVRTYAVPPLDLDSTGQNFTFKFFEQSIQPPYTNSPQCYEAKHSME